MKLALRAGYICALEFPYWLVYRDNFLMKLPQNFVLESLLLFVTGKSLNKLRNPMDAFES